MTDSIDDQTQTSEQFEYRVWVPIETPDGQTVTVQAGERGGTRLMHAESTDQSEYYFEILAYETQKSHDSLIAEQKQFLQKHSEDGTTSAATTETLHHLKGTSFDVSRDTPKPLERTKVLLC